MSLCIQCYLHTDGLPTSVLICVQIILQFNKSAELCLDSRSLLPAGAGEVSAATVWTSQATMLCRLQVTIIEEVCAKSSLLFPCFDFRDVGEKHLQFFIRYIIGILKYNQNAIKQYQTLFYFMRSKNEKRKKKKKANLHCNWFLIRYLVLHQS